MKVGFFSLGAVVRQAGGPGRPASRTKEMVAQNGETRILSWPVRLESFRW